MNEQEIIDNAPKGAAEVCFIGGEAIYNIYPFKPIRNIADIKRIVELEDLVEDIINAESADEKLRPMMYHVWLFKAKALKEPKI
jgi:hypothetical protein